MFKVNYETCVAEFTKSFATVEEAARFAAECDAFYEVTHTVEGPEVDFYDYAAFEPSKF